MTSCGRTTSIVLFFLGTTAVATMGWEKEEHRLLADSAFVLVSAECGFGGSDSLVVAFDNGLSIHLSRLLWRGKTFAEISVSASEKDISRPRFQDRGKTILNQLRLLPAELVETVWREHSLEFTGGGTKRGTVPDIFSAEQTNRNVVVNYLLHHLLALRFADIAGRQRNDSEDALRRALVYEAVAQGYLADAFSAGHMLVPLSDRIAGLHPVNSRKAHDFYRSQGVYVMNSIGEVRQTFGDKLLRWYVSTGQPLQRACATSLREFFYILYSSAGQSIPTGLQEWHQS